MDFEFLNKENWPKLASGQHSNATKDIFDWCHKISAAFSDILERVIKIEEGKKADTETISILKTEIKAATDSTKTISSWPQIRGPGIQSRKPVEQLVATNVAINELNERKKEQKILLSMG